MRLFKSKSFRKFAQKERLSDAALCSVIKEVEAGKIDADYGGGVIKQRIARAGAGKSGGYRSVILYRRGERAFFVHGFAKNKQDNINDKDVRTLKDLAASIPLAPEDLQKDLASGKARAALERFIATSSVGMGICWCQPMRNWGYCLQKEHLRRLIFYDENKNLSK
jgi:hypothetical protein